MSGAAIDFYFDFSSPYSYVASEWIGPLASKHGREVRWHAILLGVTFQAAELKSPVSHPIKREYSLHDFARSARFAGVPYAQPARFPIATQNAARVFWWLAGSDAARATQWAHDAFRAYFTRGVDLSDPAALKALAAASGLDVAQAETVWNDPH
ncbi:MAG TPA: DsbA family protein, partial [Caldimonas sp.]|nr:DsbA family protein [Caldimonas sp.]